MTKIGWFAVHLQEGTKATKRALARGHQGNRTRTCKRAPRQQSAHLQEGTKATKRALARGHQGNKTRTCKRAPRQQNTHLQEGIKATKCALARGHQGDKTRTCKRAPRQQSAHLQEGTKATKRALARGHQGNKTRTCKRASRRQNAHLGTWQTGTAGRQGTRRTGGFATHSLKGLQQGIRLKPVYSRPPLRAMESGWRWATSLSQSGFPSSKIKMEGGQPAFHCQASLQGGSGWEEGNRPFTARLPFKQDQDESKATSLSQPGFPSSRIRMGGGPSASAPRPGSR